MDDQEQVVGCFLVDLTENYVDGIGEEGDAVDCIVEVVVDCVVDRGDTSVVVVGDDTGLVDVNKLVFAVAVCGSEKQESEREFVVDKTVVVGVFDYFGDGNVVVGMVVFDTVAESTGVDVVGMDDRHRRVGRVGVDGSGDGEDFCCGDDDLPVGADVADVADGDDGVVHREHIEADSTNEHGSIRRDDSGSPDLATALYQSLQSTSSRACTESGVPRRRTRDCPVGDVLVHT